MIDSLDCTGPAVADKARTVGGGQRSPAAGGGFDRRGFVVFAAPSALAQGTSTQAVQITARPMPQSTAGSCRRDLLFLVRELLRRRELLRSLWNQQAMRATETSGTWARAAEVKSPANAAGNPRLTSMGSPVPRSGTAPPSGAMPTTPEPMAPETAKPWWPPRPLAPGPERSRSERRPLLKPLASKASGVSRSGPAPPSGATPIALTTSEAWRSPRPPALARATEVITPAQAEGASLEGIWCPQSGTAPPSGATTGP